MIGLTCLCSDWDICVWGGELAREPCHRIIRPRCSWAWSFGMLVFAGPVLRVCVRSCFRASSGTLLLSADYKQLEMRLLAAFSNDSLLQRELQQGT